MLEQCSARHQSGPTPAHPVCPVCLSPSPTLQHHSPGRLAKVLCLQLTKGQPSYVVDVNLNLQDVIVGWAGLQPYKGARQCRLEL